ncbi:unnamed protein product [Cuscuta epithymum]|uniref:feruloyl-CoA 6-hydroxylase n=1 Tax=Cuscuta epithymum TaxID=186058 RepID=A0AAV0CH18_9ASTE|nr:unnamed protein product [Cuscuta epithymum]
MAAPLLSRGPVKIGHIDDVQEVRKKHSSSIPERFVKDLTERPILTPSSCDDHLKIPVVDLHKLLTLDENSPQFLAEISNLSLACEQWGFFQLINHGVELSLLKEMEKLAMDFFMQPLEEKKKYPMPPGGIQGYGQAFVTSEDQKLDWCNMFALAVEPPANRIPSLWPPNPPHFSETLVTYTREMKGVCEKLMEYIGWSLGVRDGMGRAFDRESTIQAVRMNYYPPCPRPDLVLGLSPHSDGSALTVLQQPDFGSAGLQVLKDGTAWLPVPPIPNALVINVGDTIEVLTNGRYKSVVHRAVAHKEEDRLSIVTFYAPSYATELAPLPELVSESNPAKFRSYNHGEYSKHYVTSKLQGKKSLDFAKILLPPQQ